MGLPPRTNPHLLSPFSFSILHWSRFKKKYDAPIHISYSHIPPYSPQI
jgi:hypothetical protein